MVMSLCDYSVSLGLLSANTDSGRDQIILACLTTLQCQHHMLLNLQDYVGSK